MMIRFTMKSGSQALVKLVGEFSKGIGCEVDDDQTVDAGLQLRLPEDASAEIFLHLLSYVALTATSLGVDVNEPRCRVRYQEPHAMADVSLDFRLSALDLGRGSREPA